MDLKFDHHEIDTTKAKKFLKQHSNFSGLLFESSNTIVEDCIGSKINLTNINKIHSPEPTELVEKKRNEVVLTLAQLITDNAELFCQLEYMIRKKEPEQLKSLDLKLISQYLIHIASTSIRRASMYKRVFMDKSTSLANLGYCAYNFVNNGYVVITSTKDTAVICWLFADLCLKAGFGSKSLALEFFSDNDMKKFSYNCLNGAYQSIPEFQNGSIGVVTAKCDVDSALDTFSETPYWLPWKLKKILVQESVLQHFKNSLESNHLVVSKPNIDKEIIDKCTAVYKYKEKIFLIEFAGVEAELDRIFGATIVEAYRTVKELLILLDAYRPLALSVWSESVSESNEIIYKSPATIVWNNTFGDFIGPPKSSMSFYSHIDLCNYHFDCDDFATPEDVDFKKNLNLWLNLTPVERFKVIKDCFERVDIKLELPEPDNEDSFFWVGNRTVCAGVDLISGPVLVRNYPTFQNNTSDYIKFLIKGGALCFRDVASAGSADVLVKYGLPIAIGVNHENVLGDIVFKTKAVWTSYGTIFAN